MDWWVIVGTPQGRHVYRVGESGGDHDQEFAERAKVTHAVPVDWISQPGWDVQMTVGEPHPTLLAGAIVHDVADLARVSGAALAAYRSAEAQASKGDRMDAAERALLAMDTDEQDEWLDRRRPGINRGV